MSRRPDSALETAGGLMVMAILALALNAGWAVLRALWEAFSSWPG